VKPGGREEVAAAFHHGAGGSPRGFPRREIRTAALQGIRTHLGVSAEGGHPSEPHPWLAGDWLGSIIRAALDRLIVDGLLAQEASGALARMAAAWVSR
jgi:hypothetical protein